MNILGFGMACGDGFVDILTAEERQSTFFSSSTLDLAGLGSRVSGLRRTPRYVKIALLALLRTLDHVCSPVPTDDLGLLVATAYGCQEMSMNFMDSIIDSGPKLSSPTAFSHSVNNMAVGLLSVHLHMNGPCSTISQFGLSFAGALSTAELLLNSGRAKHVLVGAVEEKDARFTSCCAERKNFQPEPEGAVFICLGNHHPSPYSLSLLWGDEALTAPHPLMCSAESTSSLPHAVAFMQALYRVQSGLHTAASAVYHDTTSRQTCAICLKKY